MQVKSTRGAQQSAGLSPQSPSPALGIRSFPAQGCSPSVHPKEEEILCIPCSHTGIASSITNIIQQNIFLKILFIHFYRGEGREKERERNINVWLPLERPQPGTWPATQACAMTGNRTGEPLVHRLVLNPLSHTSQDRTFFFLLKINLHWHLITQHL